MSAYWVARARILDPREYGRYADRVPEILATFGGRILARGGRHQVLEGTKAFDRFVVIEFASLEAAQACYDSEAYQAAAAFRRPPAGEAEIVIVEGVAAIQ